MNQLQNDRKQKQITAETVQMYRDVFLRTPDGREVLADILNELGAFGNSLDSDEARILHNAALMIKAKLGIQLFSQIREVVESWANIPMPKEHNDNG